MSARPSEQPVIMLFDGMCNLCNAGVDFLLDHDPGRRFRFASQQSAIGQELLRRHGQSTRLTSVVVIDRGVAYSRSQAILCLARNLPWPWPLLRLAVVIPRPVADWLYDLVAQNRYRLFGQAAACRVPTPDLASRFL